MISKQNCASTGPDSVSSTRGVVRPMWIGGVSRGSFAGALLLAGVPLLAPRSLAQSTTLVSAATGGGSASGGSNLGYAHSPVSADGRFLAFMSSAPDLVTGDTNGYADVFVRDLQSNTTERVSVATGGGQATDHCVDPSISADGRYVAFVSLSPGLVAGDTNGAADVFLRDRQSSTTEIVSRATGGALGNGFSGNVTMSADGRFVAFDSSSDNLVTGDMNGWVDVFVRDRQSGTTELVSVDSNGAQGNGNSTYPAISEDGRFVVFTSRAGNLVAGDTNANADTFVHDRQTGVTIRVDVDSSGAEGNVGVHQSDRPSISADGRLVAFTSPSTNLVAGDTNGVWDVFVRDIQGGITERVSVGVGGTEANDDSWGPSISADGRFVAFITQASNLVMGDTNGWVDVFVRDRQSGTNELASVDSSGAQGNSYCFNTPWLSGNGRFVEFASMASNLVPGDTNTVADVFVRDRASSIPAADLCQPGAGGVMACPCANPPTGAPRGCDNSAGTGGAQLSSSGAASLAFDSLVFVSNGEKPTATSILLQGNAEVAGGVTFGQGVRCVGGSLKRLYVKAASGGSISAPAAGDPSVSARSAALGDTIAAGTSRWYAVYYRDPVVLGGCPATSTFNITQTQLVNWGS